MNNINSFVEKFAAENKQELVSLRRRLHKCPEMGFKEFETSKIIADYLQDLGLDVHKNVGITGVFADINSHIEDYTIALRFDMDALPIMEKTELEFKSDNVGMMHACGHDGHIAIGLGVAKLLCELRDQIPARIRLIFQPAEEGQGGAKKMIEEGVLCNPPPNLIIGFHIWPYLDSGKVGMKSGAVMAMGDKFRIRLYGKEGHGSSPHLSVDPTLMAAEVIQGLQKIVSRNIDPNESVVVSVGTIHGGNSFNIIPSNVEISGTVRMTNDELREFVKNRIEDILKGVAIGGNGAYEFEYEECFKLTVSDENLVANLHKSVTECLDEASVVYLKNGSMASEDFSEYEKYIPGLYFFLGTRNEDKGCIHPLHNALYKLDEDILTTGVTVLANLVKNICEKKACKGV